MCASCALRRAGAFDLKGYIEQRLRLAGVGHGSNAARYMRGRATFFSYRRTTLRGEDRFGLQLSGHRSGRLVGDGEAAWRVQPVEEPGCRRPLELDSDRAVHVYASPTALSTSARTRCGSSSTTSSAARLCRASTRSRCAVWVKAWPRPVPSPRREPPHRRGGAPVSRDRGCHGRRPPRRHRHRGGPARQQRPGSGRRHRPGGRSRHSGAERGEEAHFAAQGVISGLFRPVGLVGDMGGGSLEVAEALDDRVGDRWVSLPLGALPVQSLLKDGGARPRIGSTRSCARACRRLATEPVFYAVGGGFRALAKVHLAAVEAPVRVVHGYTVAADRMRAFAKKIWHLAPKSWPGCPASPAGACRRCPRPPSCWTG